ncbi:3'-5' exonuclease [Merismopedia glauca]|uniref:Exonuclease domain-containing protein n=1 Tax=Merismopedia glauca CCAP 1448/3 TaxID=1296344 RepID=A0A2T1BWW6_9CYAN|nr:3'-5' exonuclease [Merismopedia glauca]PSB00506.1 hypothetical protein C7B64_23185 [Merismopedia glauca CCAP 1448/3]
MQPDLDLDKFQAYEWANKLISGDYGDWCVLDSETTGLGDKAEIIELSIISKYGSTIFDSLIKPTVAVEPGARAVHQITDEMLEDAPIFPEVFPKIAKAIAGKTLVIYNSNFDIYKLKYAASLHELELPEFKTHCAMNWYAQYYGQWHDYWGNYTWKKLPGGSHRAKGDALACYNLVKQMAEPMSCSVDYPSPLFPAKQIGCIWSDWIEVFINVYYKPKVRIKIQLPKFGWINELNAQKESQFPGDDLEEIPF